jgi:hypothetical protein
MQTQVNNTFANGVVGEFCDDSFKKVDTYVLQSGVQANIVGYAYTISSTGIAQVGGTGVFAGILVNPKQYANFNIGLDATNEVANGVQASLSKTGRVWANVGGVANIGDLVYYDDVTGALGVGTAGAGQTQVPNCAVFYEEAEANGLCRIELLN